MLASHPANQNTPMNLTEFLGRQNKHVLVAIGIVLLLGITVGDFVTGPEFASSVFYLIPVSFFAWFIGKRVGLITAVMSAVITLVVHAAFPHTRRSVIIYWNAAAWLGVYVFFVLIIAELRGLYEREWHFSHTDVLTKLANRRAFFEILETEKERATRYGFPLTLAYLDIDHFKQINDRFGHPAGDRLLAIVAKTMQNNVRKIDVAARLGGDEFAVLLPETAADAASAVLRKLHEVLDAKMRDGHWPITFSMGAVTFQPPPNSVQEMISKADEVMYAAKTSGRDRVIFREPAA